MVGVAQILVPALLAGGVAIGRVSGGRQLGHSQCLDQPLGLLGGLGFGLLINQPFQRAVATLAG